MGRTGVEPRARSIRITFTLDGKQHKKTLVLNGAPLPPTPANMAYAERLAAEVRQRIRLGTFSMAEYFPESGDTSQPLTVSLMLTAWLESVRVQDSSMQGYKAALSFWKPGIGQRLARDVKPGDIKRAIAARPELAAKTLNSYLMALRAAFSLAVTDNQLTRNPTDDVARLKQAKADPDPFTPDEAQAIIDAMKEPDVRAMVKLWRWTGLRTGELIALQGKHIDTDRRMLVVAQSIVKRRLKPSTKTGQSRTVMLNSMAMEALEEVKGRRGFLFTTPRAADGWLHSDAFLRHHWTPTLKALGIRYRRPYNLRHTYATTMLMAGMTPAFCARQLGHSVELFLGTYSRWLDGRQNDLEMQRLERAIGSELSLQNPTATPEGAQVVDIKRKAAA